MLGNSFDQSSRSVYVQGGPFNFQLISFLCRRCLCCNVVLMFVCGCQIFYVYLISLHDPKS